MTEYFVSGEAEGMLWTGNSYTGTASNDVDLDFSRCSFGPQDSGAIHTGTLVTSASEIWLHFEVNIEIIDSQSDRNIVSLIGGGQSLLQIKGLNGVFDFEYYNGSGFTTIISGVNIIKNVLTVIDIHCKLDDINGIFALYIGNVLQDSFVGDTILSPETEIDSFTLEASRTGGTSGSRSLFSQVVVSDTITIGGHLYTMEIEANGNSTDFLGSFSDINELNVDDVDSINSSTAEESSSFVIANLPALPPTVSIKSITTCARIKNSAAGPQNAQFITRIGVTDYLTANLTGIDIGYNPFLNIENVSPATSNPWTESEANSIEIGLKSKA